MGSDAAGWFLEVDKAECGIIAGLAVAYVPASGSEALCPGALCNEGLSQCGLC